MTIDELKGKARENALGYMQDRLRRSGEPLTLEEIGNLVQAAYDFDVLFDENGDPIYD